MKSFERKVIMLSQGTEYISKIKETRIKYGLTQQQVSNITGVPFRSIQNWETGQRKCPDYVEKMVVDILDQKFGKPDHQAFIEEILEMLLSDIRYAKTEETKNYINNLITDISEHLKG
jgi:transcriptional regulator with XRE-family HTH domain